MALLTHTWPWYVAGPLLGIIAALLLLVGNRQLGISSNFRHMCAIVSPRPSAWLRYDWKGSGLWNLVFVAGVLWGGFLAARLLANPVVDISAATRADLARLGIEDRTGFLPASIFNWSSLFTLRGFVIIVLGGFLVGFGTGYGGGCTSGHGILGLAALQGPSLVAVIAFYIGGMIVTWFLYPLLLGGGS